MTDITKPPFKNILITGAGGALGSVLRESLRPYAETLSLNERRSLGEVRENEKHFICDLADRDAVFEMLKGVDMVVHMGGAPRENTFQVILDSNIVGSYNMYGVSKTFVENLSRYYFDKFGIESVCLRIGSCFPKPVDRRMLATWLSYDDFSHLCVQSIMTSSVGHMIVYGNSNNSTNFWDNTQAAYLGYRPKDSADAYRAEVYASTSTPDPRHPAIRFQGGQFAADGHFEDPKVD